MFLPDLAAVVSDCLKQVRDADQLLACLDGPDVDSGTCVEIGYAIALGNPSWDIDGFPRIRNRGRKRNGPLRLY